jgi:hypothetical protein
MNMPFISMSYLAILINANIFKYVVCDLSMVYVAIGLTNILYKIRTSEYREIKSEQREIRN